MWQRLEVGLNTPRVWMLHLFPIWMLLAFQFQYYSFILSDLFGYCGAKDKPHQYWHWHSKWTSQLCYTHPWNIGNIRLSMHIPFVSFSLFIFFHQTIAYGRNSKDAMPWYLLKGDNNTSTKHPVIMLAWICEFSSHHHLGQVESTTKQFKMSQHCFGPTKRVK